MMNRRELLGSAGALSLLPAMPALGIATGSSGAPAFEAVLRLGESHSGAGNHRWATVLAGMVTGRLAGKVQSGRLDWHVDPASGAVEAVMDCRIQCRDGEVREVRNRGLHGVAAGKGLVRLRALNPA